MGGAYWRTGGSEVPEEGFVAGAYQGRDLRMSDRPVIQSRPRRLVAFLRHNRDQLVTDAAIIFAWIVASTAVFQWLVLPVWLHYFVLFAGIIVYSRITPNWERPYRSRD